MNALTFKIIRPEHTFSKEINLINEQSLKAFCNRKPYRQEILKLIIINDGIEQPTSYCFQGKDYSKVIRSRLLKTENLNNIRNTLNIGGQ